MRTVKEIVELWAQSSSMPTFDDVIEDGAKFFYNLALEDAAENVECDLNYYDVVDRESILKLKI